MDLKFQMYELPKDVKISGADDFFEQVRKATAEAMRRGIEANAIVINENMVYVPEACGMDLKMVCGLHCYVTKDELPEGYSFAVLHDPTRDKKDAVEVVRCKDCQHSYKSSGSSTGYRCCRWGIYDEDCDVDHNGYCYKGERRNNHADD